MACKEEKETLLKQRCDSTGSYGSEVTGDTLPGEGVSEPEAGVNPPSKDHGIAAKREKLVRTTSLEKVDEGDERERAQKKFGCPIFGVKSYLHNFYDDHQRAYKDPSLYEDEDDFRYLLHPHPKRRRCTSIWWKVFVWIGANFLVFGVIGVLVGYLVPQRPIIVGSFADNIEIIDREAISFNFNLDICKLVGLILFCIGGLTLTVALLFPSFLYNYCEEERRDGSFRISVSQDEKPPLSPTDISVPVSSMISSVQPDRKADESIITKEGMVAIKD